MSDIAIAITTGEQNYVIGGQGEAEVNVKWTPEEALKELCNVAEHCGYLCYRGEWGNSCKQIHIITHGHFILVYWYDKLTEVKRRHEPVIAEFK